MRLCSRELTWISEVLNVKPCTVSDVETLVGEIAPFELAEERDNVGLLFGRDVYKRQSLYSGAGRPLGLTVPLFSVQMEGAAARKS